MLCIKRVLQIACVYITQYACPDGQYNLLRAQNFKIERRALFYSSPVSPNVCAMMAAADGPAEPVEVAAADSGIRVSLERALWNI